MAPGPWCPREKRPFSENGQPTLQRHLACKQKAPTTSGYGSKYTRFRLTFLPYRAKTFYPNTEHTAIFLFPPRYAAVGTCTHLQSPAFTLPHRCRRKLSARKAQKTLCLRKTEGA